MKTPLILTALVLSTLSLAAQAQTLECSDLAPGDQYFATITNGKAKLGENTAAGPRTLANLKCVVPHGQRPSHPDEGSVAYECAEHNKGDGGYLLEVENTGQGVMTATLSEESIAGPRELGKLVCRWNF